MAIQFSVPLGNARLDIIETTIGASPTLEIRTGAPPADAAAADSGTALATMVLPANWLQDAANRQKLIAGLWQDLNADAAGTAGHFRIKENGTGTCHIQGTVTATGGGGDMTLDNVIIALNQQVTITAFTLTDGNA